jgi:membrane-associated phospholipid phosphatase
MRVGFRRAAIVLALALPCAAGANAQSASPDGWNNAKKTTLVLGGLLALAVAEDRHISEIAASHKTPALNHFAAIVDPLGRAQYIKIGLAAGIVLPALAGKRTLAKSVLRVAISYIAADGTESLLKPLAGRHRPDSTERPFRFQPFRNQEIWHSFPSAHTTHAFALAEAIGIETGSPWVRDPLYVAAGLVGAQRVYTRAHWASDAIASAALSVVISKAAERITRLRIK